MFRSDLAGTAEERVQRCDVERGRGGADRGVEVRGVGEGDGGGGEPGKLEISGDGGATWQAMALPKKEMQVSALAVDGSGTVWVGDRDGVYSSADKGATWHALDDPYMRKVNSIYYDAGADRMLVTTAGPGTKAFSVGVAKLHVSEIDTGWNLRFVRPVGNYLVGATLFDGIVVQPRMVDSAEIEKH